MRAKRMGWAGAWPRAAVVSVMVRRAVGAVHWPLRAQVPRKAGGMGAAAASRSRARRVVRLGGMRLGSGLVRSDGLTL